MFFAEAYYRENWHSYKPQKFEYVDGWIRNWFSNMTPSPMEIGSIIWPSVENYYQAMKNPFDSEYFRVVLGATPKLAKKLGRKAKIDVEMWEASKETHMHAALWAKFNQPKWKEQLLATGDELIVEWNNWKDIYWGYDVNLNRGRNVLGIHLMAIRDKLRSIS